MIKENTFSFWVRIKLINMWVVSVYFGHTKPNCFEERETGGCLSLMEQLQKNLVSLGYFKTQPLPSTFLSCLLLPGTLVEADVTSELANIMIQLFQIAHRLFLLLFLYHLFLHLLTENICVYFQMDARKDVKSLLNDFLWENSVNNIDLMH